ncbi:hypothetical protein JRO89_XS01G0007300 [Xanthoceras sorbifolium]|uniref:PGG domain-containing protein n=1 Tax=Xanthoceras sorbifolium TaxID=99658 RepID=A0ABQ8IIA9_9ROSI|nr:hypothetical protein JRO89_XS01G0007300 [Xanthoceras sorbifolium]
MEINKMVNNYPVDSNNSTRRGNYIKNWFFQDSSDLESDFRNNMLVVATLTVAVTFQTGINPPGGAWQDTKEGAGRAILASLHFPYNLFLILNTLAFSMSTQQILVLLYPKKLYFEAPVARVSMVATYVTAVWSLSPEKDVKFRYVCLAALFPYLWRLCYQTFETVRSDL